MFSPTLGLIFNWKWEKGLFEWFYVAWFFTSLLYSLHKCQVIGVVCDFDWRDEETYMEVWYVICILYWHFIILVQMITKNFEDYPEHRLKFFSLLRAIATFCFPALIKLSSQVSEYDFAYFFIANGLVSKSCLIICWSSLLIILHQQLKLVMDSIIWAFRHTERNIAETGLNLLLAMLQNFQVWYLFSLC